jgi:hypothetical protein
MPEENWPEFKANKFEVEQQLNLHYHYNDNDLEDDDDAENIFNPSHFNEYLKLIKLNQYAFRFIHLARVGRIMKKVLEHIETLKNDTHNRALRNEIKSLLSEYHEKRKKILHINFMYKHVEYLCIKKAQSQEFRKEIKILKSGRQLSPFNRIYKLNPFLDSDGLIRVTTRIPLNPVNVKEFGYDRICPILLPKVHPLTSLIILKYHVNNKHSLKNSVVANIMKRFHIPHIKWIVNQTIKTKCLNCRQEAAKPEPPQLGDLPAVRLAHHTSAFVYSMVDIAGPIVVNIYRTITAKRYIFVYSCLTTRAIHLELLEHIDSDSTLRALSNTFNLRGAAKIIYSDCGTNFKGASAMLEADSDMWNKILLEKGVITEPVEWKFGPARSPHSQGAVERMVGLTKTILNKIIEMSEVHRKLLKDFMLISILYEVIGILNNRPLTLVPIEGTDTEFLTPNFFLINRQTIQTIPCTTKTKTSIVENYEDLKIISNILWNHWIQYYMPTILMREKWIDSKEPLKVGDIVITVDTLVANSWRIGKIVEVVIGSKNQAREYKVMLGKNNRISEAKKLTPKMLLKQYKNEKYSVVSRGALAVAKLDVDAIKM